MEEIEKLLNSSKSLEGNCPGIYFLFDRDELVYVGKGWNCLLGIAEQTKKDSDKKFTSWNYLKENDKNEYNRIAKELIKKYNPKYNKTHREKL